jgi:hypothetical protein
VSAFLDQLVDVVAFLLGLFLIFGSLAIAADYLERRFGP